MTIHLYWWMLPLAAFFVGGYITARSGDYGFSLGIGTIAAICLTVGHFL